MRRRAGAQYAYLRRGLLATGAILLFVLVGWFPLEAGVLTRHMALHIGLMSVLAPALAVLFRSTAGPGHGHLLVSTAAQLSLFLAWHAPAGMALGMSSGMAQLTMHISLLAAALWFWRNVLASAGSSPWWTIAGLLLTGKVFCLVAALLVFAPRLVYPAMSNVAADQQLAGLLMLVACPMTYILASTIVVSRWLWSSLENVPREPLPQA